MPESSLLDLPAHVAMALSLASSTTGADYNYLLKTAQRESSFQTDARAATSSATGLFQFIEETWIRTIKDEGARFGLGEYADKIVKTEAGKYLVPDPADRKAILALRKDPQISAMMAGVYARRNADYIRSEIGRTPTSGELYIAHFLGPTDAARLIRLRDTQQSLSAPDLFPKAAEANRTIFYTLGQPRSVGEVYDLLISRHKHGAKPSVAAKGFSVDADFGTWDAEVERVYTVKAAAPTKQFAGMSIFDFFAGGGDKADAPALAVDLESGWDAEIEEPAVLASAVAAATPTRIESGSTSGGLGFAGTIAPDAIVPDAVEPTPALAFDARSSVTSKGTSRLKIIRVTKSE